jgi:glycosyltransferase involved in cell wall biosynthesis
MKNNIKSHRQNGKGSAGQPLAFEKYFPKDTDFEGELLTLGLPKIDALPEVLLITSYPPRECGIANYSHDLFKALNNKFNQSIQIKICALESDEEVFNYPEEVKYTLKTSSPLGYVQLARSINQDTNIQIVLIQHEFGFFKLQEQAFTDFLNQITKPLVIVFHSVLPRPDSRLRNSVQQLTAACTSVIVMTHNSMGVLTHDYGIPGQKISVIAHGTHLVTHLDKKILKKKFGLKGRKILTTFGLLSSGKSIETTIEALPAIVATIPEVIFLVIGKTHPEVVKNDGEVYRESLEQRVKDLDLQNHVRFINKYLALPELLDYLQLTDIYLFTTCDPNQAVSGTFAYAMSCACPIISTPIPHTREVLTPDTGIIIDFDDPLQLGKEVIKLLNDNTLRKHLSVNSLQKIISTTWENSAISHAMLFENLSYGKINLKYNLPEVNLDHLNHMTTSTGIIQFSKLNRPDLGSGFTLDDNARAMVASCMQFKLTGDHEILKNISIYLAFISRCQQPAGDFLNYLDKEHRFTTQNQLVNLDDSNGRAVWALGYVISLKDILPEALIFEAMEVLKKALFHISTIQSTRAIAFTIKGLYYYQIVYNHFYTRILIKSLSSRLEQMFYHESGKQWIWFESYLTYANSIMPEAMLYAWQITKQPAYKEIAISSLDFLISQTFDKKGIKVITNQNWLQKGELIKGFGEQPIDVAYTILTLGAFYDVFQDTQYLEKMKTAFNWFLGHNHLHQIIYNPCTGGCYDGLEENNVNLNQGAESTVSYLMARMTMEQYFKTEISDKKQYTNH